MNRHAAVVVVVFASEENDTPSRRPPPFPLPSARNPPISRFLPMGNAKIATAAWGAAAESARVSGSGASRARIDSMRNPD